VQQQNLRTSDELWEAAAGRLPEFSPAEQRAGLVLLEELTRGEPVAASQLAEALGIEEAKTERYLQDSGLSPLVLKDEEGSALGFFGLSTVATDHRFIVHDRTLWTWCAVDTLFLPELLGTSASVESIDPVTGEPITLTVSPTTVKTAQADGILVSMSSPEAWETTSALRLIATACHFIHFFGSPASGQQWTESHPHTVLLPLDQAFAYGRRQNSRMFGAGLAERASSRS
jgi:alkylmercury lyase